MIAPIVLLLACSYLASAFSPSGVGCDKIHASRLFATTTNDGEEDDEEIIRLLRGPLGATTRTRTKAIYTVSDTTGGMAKSAVERALVQFNGCDDRFVGSSASDEDDECEVLQTKSFTFCRTEEDVAKVIKKAAKHEDAMVVYTFAEPELREKTVRMCELEGLIYLDLLEPIMSKLADFFQRQPIGKPSRLDRTTPRRRRALSNSYYRRIEAVEFTLKADDGQAPNLLSEADVIITGVSRTGKTPLSIVLSQSFGIKVANVPLMPEVAPPRQLLDENIDSRRVFCLTLNPADLQRIRKTRLSKELEKVEGLGESHISNYADRKYLIKDLMNAKRLTDDHSWTEIDVSGRAVEETASLIGSVLNERFPDEI